MGLVMNVEYKLLDIGCLTKINSPNVYDAYAYSMLNVSGVTTISFESLVLEDHGEIIYRCVEINSFITNILNHNEALLRFGFEPVAEGQRDGDRIIIKDFSPEHSIIDRITTSDAKLIGRKTDRFLDETLGPFSQQLREFFRRKLYLRDGFRDVHGERF
jgi:hypothetical protein